MHKCKMITEEQNSVESELLQLSEEVQSVASKQLTYEVQIDLCKWYTSYGDQIPGIFIFSESGNTATLVLM